MRIINQAFRKLMLVTVAFIAVCALNTALAQNGFNIQVGESARLLEAQVLNSRGDITDAQLAEIMAQETCINPVARYQYRNRFSVLVENTSSTNDLTSFSIDIQDSDYIFGDGDFVGDGFIAGMFAMDVGRSDAGVSFTATTGLDASEIVVNFTGLNPGDAAIFRVDLDPSATNSTGIVYSDFRDGLLGANGNDIATVDVGFAAGQGFNDLELMTPLSSMNINTAGIEAYHAQQMAFSFGITQTTIPEPTTATLVGLAGMLAQGMIRRRRR